MVCVINTAHIKYLHYTNNAQQITRVKNGRID